jgi:hypothetical protein
VGSTADSRDITCQATVATEDDGVVEHRGTQTHVLHAPFASGSSGETLIAATKAVAVLLDSALAATATTDSADRSLTKSDVADVLVFGPWDGCGDGASGVGGLVSATALDALRATVEAAVDVFFGSGVGGGAAGNNQNRNDCGSTIIRRSRGDGHRRAESGEKKIITDASFPAAAVASGAAEHAQVISDSASQERLDLLHQLAHYPLSLRSALSNAKSDLPASEYPLTAADVAVVETAISGMHQWLSEHTDVLFEPGTAVGVPEARQGGMLHRGYKLRRRLPTLQEIHTQISAANAAVGPAMDKVTQAFQKRAKAAAAAAAAEAIEAID